MKEELLKKENWNLLYETNFSNKLYKFLRLTHIEKIKKLDIGRIEMLNLQKKYFEKKTVRLNF